MMDAKEYMARKLAGIASVPPSAPPTQKLPTLAKRMTSSGYSHRSALVERYQSKIERASNKIVELTAKKFAMGEGQKREYLTGKIDDLTSEIDEYKRLIPTVYDGTHPVIIALELNQKI